VKKAGILRINRMSTKPKVLAVIGPTASGKTALSLLLAGKLKSKFNKEVEIISADSRQVYKHIPITTAQPSAQELNLFKHHFINELELDEEFNAGEFGRKGRDLVRKIFAAGKIPVIVGGSGLYINSLIYGFFELDQGTAEQFILKQRNFRKELNERLEAEGLDALVNELKKVDPLTISNMKEISARRVIRALEVYYSTGLPISVQRKKKISIDFDPVLIGINHNREELYSRINDRTEIMISSGLIDEIRLLNEKELHYRTVNSLNTVGAKEVFDYLHGILTLDEMKDLIKQNTRRFAKRQLTWFRKDKNIAWLKPGVDDFPELDELSY
jgi:tRNA dimethylallyltransferase